eukprot:649426_1
MTNRHQYMLQIYKLKGLYVTLGKFPKTFTIANFRLNVKCTNIQFAATDCIRIQKLKKNKERLEALGDKSVRRGCPVLMHRSFLESNPQNMAKNGHFMLNLKSHFATNLLIPIGHVRYHFKALVMYFNLTRGGESDGGVSIMIFYVLNVFAPHILQ